MQHTQQLFLEALKAALKNEQVEWNNKLEAQEWMDLFRMAEVHQILPMIYEAVYRSPAAGQADPQILAPAKAQMVRTVIMQTQKTGEFEPLYRYLRESGICPLVVKGIVCRNIYPNPDYRISGDEDLLIRPEDFRKCHDLLREYGMQTSEQDMDAEELESVYEVPYGKKGSLIYIELHKSLFPPESEAYGDLNRFFANVHEDAIDIRIDGTDIRTMGYTDHLFYLICHSFKHFLHRGFGIRQVCDICLFTHRYGEEVDWPRLAQRLEQARAEVFAANLLAIGRKYLGFSAYPEAVERWMAGFGEKLDCEDLLADLLASGIYGSSSLSRQHSSLITLNAVKDGTGGRGAHRVLRTMFPARKDLLRAYPYLERYPWLLPAAWVQRLGRYQSQNRGAESAKESLSIGTQRVELLKKYQVIR